MTYRDWLRERAARPQAVFAQAEPARMSGPAFASGPGGVALRDMIGLPNWSVLVAPGLLLLLLGGGVFWGLRLRDKPAAYLAVPALEERRTGGEGQQPPAPAAVSAVGEPVELVEAALASAAPPPDEIVVKTSAVSPALSISETPPAVEAASAAHRPELAQVLARQPSGENVSVSARVVLAHSFEPSAPDSSTFFCLKAVDPNDATASVRIYGRKGQPALAAFESGLAWGEEKEVAVNLAWRSTRTDDPNEGYWEIAAVAGE